MSKQEHIQAAAPISLHGIAVARISTIAYFAVSQLQNQLEYLRAQGMRVVLICSQGTELSKLKFGNGLSYVPIELTRDFHPMKDAVALWSLIKIFHRYRFSIVHSTTPKAGLLTAIAGLVCRVPVRLHTFTGQRWATLAGLMGRVTRISDKVIALLNTRCYADSVSQRELLIREKIVPAKKIAVIGKGSLAGVDLDRFDREKWLNAARETRRSLSINKNSKVILFIGRITEDKGIAELLGAFGRLSRSYDVDLVLLGPVDRDYERVFPDPLKFAANNPRVHAIGYTDCPERYLAIADVLCLPSYREGFGTVVIEAAAMGVPTVGTRITGLCDAVIDGKTGTLVPPRSERHLFSALKQLLDDPALLSTLGAAARARCVMEFDAQVINHALVKEYAHLLKLHLSDKR